MWREVFRILCADVSEHTVPSSYAGTYVPMELEQTLFRNVGI